MPLLSRRGQLSFIRKVNNGALDWLKEKRKSHLKAKTCVKYAGRNMPVTFAGDLGILWGNFDSAVDTIQKGFKYISRQYPTKQKIMIMVSALTVMV